MAWWAARQNGLHPRLIDSIRRHSRDKDDLHLKARLVWNLIAEHQSDPRQLVADFSQIVPYLADGKEAFKVAAQLQAFAPFPLYSSMNSETGFSVLLMEL